MCKLLLILLFPAFASAQSPMKKLVAKNASATPVVSDPFITDDPVGATPQNNYGDYIGFGFTVGASDIVVTSIGRWVISGNSGTHTLKIVNGSNVTMATASLNTSGLSVGYNYASCTPTTLTAGTTYYVFSLESNGGDQWYNYQNHTTTADGTIIGAYYIAGAITLAAGGTFVYGPVNFKYHL